MTLNLAITKAKRRLVPFLLLLYVLAFLDRVNVGFAKVAMMVDTGLSAAAYAFGAGLFFAGYALLEVPSNLILHRVGARRWLARIMVSWGIISAAMMFAWSEPVFYMMRLLLGAAEAGFFPGVILYLTYWFPAAERGRVMGLFYFGAPLAFIFGGPVSGLLMELSGEFGLRGWQWMFLVEGLLASVVGVWTYFYLTDRPADAGWLTPEERHILQSTMDAEETARASSGSHHLGDLLKDRGVMHLCLIYFLIQVSVYGVVFALPSQVERLLGKAAGLEVGLVTAIPWVCALIAAFLIPRFALGRRRQVACLVLVTCALGLGLATQASPVVALIGLCVAAAGFISVQPVFWTFPTERLAGAAAAGGIALINSIGNLGGFVAPSLREWVERVTGSANSGLLVLMGVTCLAALVMGCLRDKQTQISDPKSGSGGPRNTRHPGKLNLLLMITLTAVTTHLVAADGFWFGQSKDTLQQQSLQYPRTIWNAMLMTGGITKYTRIILVRDGKCIVLKGWRDLDAVRELPILKDDQVQTYSAEDLLKWNLPVFEGSAGVDLLLESERKRKAQSSQVMDKAAASHPLSKEMSSLNAADWPRWRGASGDGSWNPENVPANYAARAPVRLWKMEIGGGFGGVTVSEGRVYVMDRSKSPADTERVLCFKAESGERLWAHVWSADYADMDHGTGPRASVTIHEQRAYALGAAGMALCLDAVSGKVIWQVDTVKEHGAKVPTWGFAASPVIDKARVLLHVGAQPDGSVIALDKLTGKLVWRGGPDPAGYCTPEIITHRGQRQLIAWGPEHVQSLNPDTGALLWTYPYKITYGVSIAQPVYHDGLLLVSGYWHGTKVLRLGEKPTEVTLAWENEKDMCGLMSAPLLKDGVVYLLDKSRGLQAIELISGKILWSDDNTLTPKDRNPQMSLVWLRESEGLASLLNASGELVYVRLKTTGFEELARHQIIGKTWAHPAFAGSSVYARSDSELVGWRLWE